MKKSKRFLCIFSLLAAMFYMTSCGDDGDKTPTTDPSTDPSTDPNTDPDPSTDPVVQTTISHSTSSCVLDSDCIDGAFCFHNICTTQCTSGNDCASGFACSPTNGRCVTVQYLTRKKLRSTKEALSQADSDMAEANASDVKSTLIGESVNGNTISEIDIIQSIPKMVFVHEGDKTVTVSFITRNNIGKVQYIERASEDAVVNAEAHKLLEVSPKDVKVEDVDGSKITAYEYTIELHPIVTNTANGKNAEGVVIDSNAGIFEVMLVKAQPASGVYSGTVQPTEVLSGIGLPIRMAIVTTPEMPKSFADIKSISLYLPSSGSDLFSPESVKMKADGTTDETWAKVEMKEDSSGAGCSSKERCFIASYSTNNYIAPASELITEDHKINRNIRIELTDYDLSNLTFSGFIKDSLTGLYRINEVSGTNVTKKWNDDAMIGDFTLDMQGIFDESLYTIKNHTPDSVSSDLRAVEDLPVEACSDEAVKLLMARIPATPSFDCTALQEIAGDNCTEAALNECKEMCADDITSEDCSDVCKALLDQDKCENWVVCNNKVTEYENKRSDCQKVDELSALNNIISKDDETENPELRQFCVEEAARGILGDDALLSDTLRKVLQQGTETGGNEGVVKLDASCGNKELNNFADFEAACNDSNCSLCANKPEIACAADQIARIYLAGKGTDEELAKLMKTWLELMRESYLGQEYNAWSQDTAIRKDWLTGAVYSGTFAADIMNSFNENLLTSYESNVLDVQHSIMARQFSQTSLEMLAQTLKDKAEDDKQPGENITDLSAIRNDVLRELNQTWTSVGEALALDARRHDVLSQNDMARKNAAKKIRPYLFDLYFSGLVETNINIGAGQSSLNDSYGSNLASIVEKLNSLDRSFESLVFMRDGEVLKDTSVHIYETDNIMAIRRDAAKEAVENAITKRYQVFTDQEARIMSAQAINDNYKTSLESMRSQLISLCGYTFGCDQNDDTCLPNTAVYQCGLKIENDSKAILNNLLTEKYETSSTLQLKSCTITNGQINDKGEVEKTEGSQKTTYKCGEAGSGISGPTGSTDSSSNDNLATSKAGLAILDYRQAYEEYQAAVSEYQTHNQQAENTRTYLTALGEKIVKWYDERSKALNAIDTETVEFNGVQMTLEAILEYLAKEDKKAEEALAKYNNAVKKANDDAYNDWQEMTDGYERDMRGAIGTIAGAQTASIGLDVAIGRLEETTDNDYLRQIMINTTKVPGATGAEAIVGKTKTTVATVLSYVKQGMDEAIVAAETVQNVSQLNYDLGLARLEQNTQKTISDAEDTLNEVLDTVESNKAAGEDAIQALREKVERLKEANASQETLERDIDNYNEKAKDFNNFLLELVPMAHNVKSKEIAMYRALMNYLEIVQQAQLLESQYKNKKERFDESIDTVYAASKFFEYSSDLEAVDTYIEDARDALSDYLTALEYVTVRPYIELRRGIYTARGTNELFAIYNSLGKIVSSCGNGNDTDNKVNISLAEQLALNEDSPSGLSKDDRFHYILQSSTLPLSSQVRYSVNTTVGTELLKKKFYSASFTLGQTFANVRNSCNAKINDIQVRFISKPGTEISKNGTAPVVSLFYSGQAQLISCQSNIAALAKSVPGTTYGEYSKFAIDPFGGALNASIYDVPADTNYKIDQSADYQDVTVYNGLKGYPLMATYSLVFDPDNNTSINWENVADIEIRFTYTTNDLLKDSDKTCSYK